MRWLPAASSGRIAASLALLLFAGLAAASGLDRLSPQAPALARLVPLPFRAQATRASAAQAIVRLQPRTALLNARRAVAADPVDPSASGLLGSEARALLAKFGLGAEHVMRDAATLSPGERTRAELALFMASGVNCLVLDEPTNHLDLPAIEQLEQALNAFDGTLLLVTHDRALLEAVALDRTIELGLTHEPA